MTPRLTALNLYRLTAPGPAFEAAVAALAARVQREGDPGVMGYRFYVNAAEGLGRAVVDYATPRAWIGHHEIAMPWPEMKALHGVARLQAVTFLGEVTPEILAWISGSGLAADIEYSFTFVAGWTR
jgi:hypothetical protein